MTRLGVVMDPIAAIHPEKDSTLAMMLAATMRGWTMEYMEQGDLRIRDGRAEATMRPVKVADSTVNWFELGAPRDVAFGELDIVLMRKDPPVDNDYVSATHILERAEADGVTVVNSPRGLRDANEKLFATRFAQFAPATLVANSMPALHAFLEEEGKIVVKPLDAMGGRGIVMLRREDPNARAVVADITHDGVRFVMAQRFIEDVVDTGDKRILLIDGTPVPHAIKRIPRPGEFLANIAAGGSVHPADLTTRDLEICAALGPILREHGLRFVGIDVVGGYLTEVNVTSPTCIRQIDRLFGVDVAAAFLDALERGPPQP